MEMTYHVRVQRAERVRNIIEKIGIGQVIKEKYVNYEIGQAGQKVCQQCFDYRNWSNRLVKFFYSL